MERRAPDPGPRGIWMLAVVALVVGVGFTVIIVFDGQGPRTATDPPATPVIAPAATPIPAPTDALAVRGDGMVLPGPSPARSAPPDAAAVLRIEFPADGDTVVSRRINVFGRAPAGSRVLRELPDGSTAGADARDDGLWILGVDLDPGLNELRFRVDGGSGAAIVVRVTYQPR